MTNREIQEITLESLRDWFKKEKWVRISSSGNIAGPCGTSKNKKNPDRCLPRAKAQSLTKAQRAATARKKKKAGAKGKTVVKNTKAAKVTREDIRNLVVGTVHEIQNEGKSHTIDLGNIKSDDLWMIASHLKDATINGKTGPISDLISQAAEMLEDSETESLNEKDDRCTRLAKQKYDTWPSAYASGAVVRCRRGEIWKKK